MYCIARPKGATIRYLGGGQEFLPGHLFISQERLKALICSPQDRLEIFISTFILYLFEPPVWVKYLFPP